MDIFESILSYLMKLSTIGQWNEAQSVLKRVGIKKPTYWLLPLLACEAVGGRCVQALPAAAAIACLHISLILIDDMLDEDPRGEFLHIGMPAAANLATAFQAAGLEAIAGGEMVPERKLQAINSLNQMIQTTTLGQYRDTQNPKDEASFWRMVRTKSSPFFGAALYVGALLGGASNEMATKIKQFGELYGEIIQIHDDLNDAMVVPANPDWTQGRSPLPILYAQVVDHPDKARFIDLLRTIPDPLALKEAQTILIRCGAVSYCIDRILRTNKAARQILMEIPLRQKKNLEGLLDATIEPVRKMFSGLGIEWADGF